jgi:hypothetical protein
VVLGGVAATIACRSDEAVDGAFVDDFARRRQMGIRQAGLGGADVLGPRNPGMKLEVSGCLRDAEDRDRNDDQPRDGNESLTAVNDAFQRWPQCRLLPNLPQTPSRDPHLTVIYRQLKRDGQAFYIVRSYWSTKGLQFATRVDT